LPSGARTQAFNSDFKLRAQKAGVPVIPIHATRRTCATLLVALDVHPRVAMAVFRHSWIALTMEVYSQVSSTSTRDALKRLGSGERGTWDALYLSRGADVSATRPVFTGDTFLKEGCDPPEAVMLLQHPCALRPYGVTAV
jgi:hypothetical protein